MFVYLQNVDGEYNWNTYPFSGSNSWLTDGLVTDWVKVNLKRYADKSFDLPQPVTAEIST